MRIFALVFLVFGLGSVGLSQTGGLSGVVMFDGKPVRDAAIRLSRGVDFTAAEVARTDDVGRFTVANVEPGRYRILASFEFEVTRNGRTHSQFAEALAEVTVTSGSIHDLVLTAEVTQVSSVHRVREHVEIAADRPQPIDEVSKTVDLIDGQEMRDRADFTLVDTLRTIPGFRIQQLGGFGRTASIKSRGLRNQDTALLVDGIRFRDPGSITGDATPFLSDFTLTSIERIEVLRGSGSSLYGTNAIGGTIDFQTPEPRNGFHGQLSGAAGGLGLGRFRSNLSYGERSFGISGGLSRTAYTEGIDGEDNAGNTNFQTRVDYRPSLSTNISGRFFVSRAQVRLNVSPDTLGTLPSASTIIDAEEGINFQPDENDPDSIQRSRFFSGQLHVKQMFGTRLSIEGFYQGLDTDRENEDGLLGPGFQSEFTSEFGGAIHTANVHAVWRPTPSHTTTAGYEFELERFRNSGGSGTDSFRTRAGQGSNTLYAQHNLSLLDGDLQVTGGARAQWFSLSTPRFTPDGNPYAGFTLADPPAAYTFDGSASYFIRRTGTKLRMHAGNGYRVPSLYERFGTFFFLGGFFPQGNPELKPERSIGLDGGIDQYLLDGKVKATATWFYTRIKDEITYLPTDDFGAPVYYNFDRHYSRGGEFSVDVRPNGSSTIFASYTFTNSDIRNFRRPTITTVASTDRAAFGIPDHQFTFVATQRIRRFWISFDLLATSSYLAPVFSSSTFTQYTYRFRGNRRADLTAGYTFPIRNEKYNLRLFGTIENLFDYDYFENGFRTVPRNARVGLSFSF